ncbi:DUF397 domain-containing protein [Streptomyces sp. NPDC003077]|uniref:DUF397 domain-containing protein n=1 Tax=Streptomyces sp. NPDC003077 TaxID=3154443 RepID=UPI0033A99B99
MSSEPIWRKSSYSGPQGGDCVEFAAGHSTVRVRDSKNRSGPALAVCPRAWTSFVHYVRSHPRGTVSAEG